MTQLLLWLVVTHVVLQSSVANAQDWGDWYDGYRLDYTYGTSASNGPVAWGNVDGVGEWVDFDLSGRVAAEGNQCNAENRQSPILLDARRQFRKVRTTPTRGFTTAHHQTLGTLSTIPMNSSKGIAVTVL